MKTNDTLTHAVGDWLSLLMAAERTADAMRAEIDEQSGLLDRYDADASEPSGLQAAQSRMSARLKDVDERFQAAQRFADEVSQQLASAETDFRHWAEQVSALRHQLALAQTL